MSRTAVAMGPTVGGAWITVGTNGVVRVGAAALNRLGAARGCMAASRMVGAPGSEPGSATGSMVTSAATGSTSTGAVVGSVTAGSTVVVCSSTVVDVVGASTTTANDRSVVGPRGRAVGSVLDDVATCGLTGVEGSSVLTAGVVDDGSEAASDTVDVVVDGWSASVAAGVASVSGFVIRSWTTRCGLCWRLVPDGLSALVVVAVEADSDASWSALVVEDPDSVEVTPEEVASVVVSGAVALGVCRGDGESLSAPGPDLAVS